MPPFRHLLEAHDLTRAIFAEVSALLSERKLLLREGTIVDATIIAAPSSTKNAGQTRDPEMHQVKKRNQWYFGMKAHIGADAQSGLVHSMTARRPTSPTSRKPMSYCLGRREKAMPTPVTLGVEKRPEIIGRSGAVRWYVAAKRGQVKAMAEGQLKELTQTYEKAKAQVRARVEHPFHIIKNLSHHRKTRYRGLAKNTARAL